MRVRFRIERKRNKENSRVYMRAYYLKNKERFLINAVARQHAKAGLISDFTVQDWADALEHFAHSCAYCGAVGNLEKEHIVPVAAGGGFTRLNIVPACRPCNQSKKHRLLHEWYRFSESYSDVRLFRLVHWLYGEAGALCVNEKFDLRLA